MRAEAIRSGLAVLLLLPALVTEARAGHAGGALPVTRPAATVDLTTADGVAQVAGTWRYQDAVLAETAFRSPGPDGKPSGPPNTTFVVAPAAQAAGFDDSSWDVIDPGALDARRSTGKACFAWYRFRFTIPDKVGDVDPTGSTVVFTITVDDYAEVWVDGELPRDLGQSGGTVVAGFNVPNRVVVARDARPGAVVQIAVFAMNGPLSAAPENFIWVREAGLAFYSEPRAIRPVEVALRVDRLDPALDRLVPSTAKAEKVAEGFTFLEGPVWLPEGALLMSDPNQNRIYRWGPDGTLTVVREHSGYSGEDVAAYGQPGSNGLTLDPRGFLTACEHGNRRVTLTEADGSITVLADRYQGRRLNSPNDLVYRSDGTLYFTDPPFGLPAFHEDPRRELDVFGVYSLRNGVLRLESAELRGPNGIAFSPDERYLYVTNWDEARKVIMRYVVGRNGALRDGEVFYDMTSSTGWQALDGLKVDRLGDLYVSGPGGVWVISPEGTHLGTLVLPELPANMAWGDDGRTLYLASRTGLYRVPLLVEGAVFPAGGTQ